MSTLDLPAHISNPIAAAPAIAASSESASDSGISFGDLLDIVNPLQHIPIVSTIYRAITGDQIKTFPKIAGDTLFGGVEGFVSSVADTIFEKFTGKNVGDTVLAWVEKQLSNLPSAVSSAASATPANVTPASIDAIVIPGQDAWLTALTRKNVDHDLVLRATTAYRSSLDISSNAASTALH